MATGDWRRRRRHGVLGPSGSADHPPDMTQWLSVAHDHGRVDLDAATLNNRRDTFLRSALDQL
jgi:hypothetical protein